ncbi:MAG: dihydroorotase, partial [Brevundimonas sp.]
MTVFALLNARLLDPASGYDGPGAVLVEDGRIRDVLRGACAAAPARGTNVDARGPGLAPGR